MIKRFEEILNAERDKLLEQFNQEFLPPVVAVENIQNLMNTQSLNGTKLEPIAGLRKNNAYIWYQEGMHSCWVKAQYTGYRQAYDKFFQQVYGTSLKVPANYDIDHLFNQRRGQKYAQGFLRVFPVAKHINRQHGALFERKVTGSESKRPMKTMHFMSFISILKVIGLRSPKSINDDEAFLPIIKRFCADGSWSPDQVRQSLTNLILRIDEPNKIIIVKASP